MPRYSWEGRTANGSVVRGELEAPSRESVTASLRTQRITVIRVDEREGGKTGASAAPAPSPPAGGPRKRGGLRDRLFPFAVAAFFAALGVGAAWIRPQEKEVSYTCQVPGWIGPRMNGPVPTCVYTSTLTTLRRAFEGGGFYVLSEYTIDGQGFRMGDEKDGVELFPIVYQFCANWDETKREVPANFFAMNKFCGVRMMFQSESREELRNLPAGHETVYDRVLDKLLAKYGHPDRFVRRGQVMIETEDGSSDVEARKYSIWRWCPARDRAFHMDCEASVTMTIDTP